MLGYQHFSKGMDLTVDTFLHNSSFCNTYDEVQEQLKTNKQNKMEKKPKQTKKQTKKQQQQNCKKPKSNQTKQKQSPTTLQNTLWMATPQLSIYWVSCISPNASTKELFILPG